MTRKSKNYYKILRVLYYENELTKLNISQIAGLSIPTVSKNIDELAEDGFIKVPGVAASSGGRKPVLLMINDNARYSLGTDISPDRVRIILTNIRLKVIDRLEFDIDKKVSFDEIINRIGEESEKIIKKNQINHREVLGMGISIHGIIAKNKMVLSLAPNMNLKDVDFRRYMDRFNFEIYIENEANCGVLAERFFLEDDSITNISYISINEGLGSGAIINRRVFKGTYGRAVELGHMKIGNEDRICGCGSRDCWETYCSVNALLKDYILNTGDQVKDVREIFQLYEDGNKIAEKVLSRYMDYLADGIRNTILIMDPEIVIIGGYISRFSELIKGNIMDRVYGGCNLYSSKETQVKFSLLHEDASIIGAALLPLDKIHLP